MKLSQKLKECRKINHLTQLDVASKLNVSRKTISGWENSRSFPDINSLVNLSDLYNVSLDSLLRDDQLLDEYSLQNIHLLYSKKITMIFYYINILLLGAVLFSYKSSSVSIISLFLIINIVVFLSHYSSWIRFKNKLYFLLSFFTLIIISIFNMRILSIPTSTSTYIAHANKYTILGFWSGRFLFSFALAVSVVIIIFLNPDTTFLKKYDLK
ncbi:MAG: helix-turn-helix transcriptional regulator [Liquorilactobacillus hordei]|uniref:helix-turn-helix domain-containing protein n=1 Tax=Liquorilactobacillus hordei TaxID=468911 RepID=UPI0039EA0A16